MMGASLDDSPELHPPGEDVIMKPATALNNEGRPVGVHRSTEPAPVVQNGHGPATAPSRSPSDQGSTSASVVAPGSNKPDESPDRKRKRTINGPSLTDGSTSPTETMTGDGPASDGPSRFTQVAVDEKTSKRIKVVSYQEYRDRHNGIRSIKRRVPADRSQLPAHVWQRIFLFCSPPSLARLSRVNRLFRSRLIKSAAGEALPSPGGGGTNGDGAPAGADDSPALLEADAIWAASRTRFFPDLPSPLQGFSELDMWRLIAGHFCQYCGRRPDHSRLMPVEFPGARPLGETGVAVFWAFGFRSCVACFLLRTEKVRDLLSSPGGEGGGGCGPMTLPCPAPSALSCPVRLAEVCVDVRSGCLRRACSFLRRSTS